MTEKKKPKRKAAAKTAAKTPATNRQVYFQMDMPNKLPLVEGWARDGMTDVDIAANLKISRQTLHNWKKRHPEFAEALAKGKEIVDRIIENELYKNAIGHVVWEEKQELLPVLNQNGEPERDENGRPIFEMRTVERRKKFIKGDTTAQIFWLKNRKPAQWRDKQHVEHSGGVGLDLSYMQDDEIEAELKRLEALEDGD